MVLVPVKKPKADKKARCGFCTTALYRWFITSPLTGPVTTGRGAKAIPNMWPGDIARGQEILDGMFEHGGHAHNVTIFAALPENASPEWLRWFHSFAWLSDLKALGTTEAAHFARERISEWIAANANWNEHSWAIDATAKRVCNWMMNWNFLIGQSPLDDIDREFKKRAVQSLVRDTRHLVKSSPGPNAGYVRFIGAKGFVVSAHAFFNRARMKNESIKRLEAEIAKQILPDGGHVERNPQIIANALNDMIEIKNMLANFGEDVPGWLQSAIDRTAPMLRMLRHPDGGLALFNGASVGDNGFLDNLLLQSGSTAATLMSAPYSGFERLSSGATHIIMDTGMPGGPGSRHHAGTLSFEMSSNNQRMVVNCGDREGTNEPWHAALAATAAHSTLVVNDTSSSAERGNGRQRRGPLNVTHKRGEMADEGIVVEASHDGYANIFGLTHHRAIFLSPGGNNVRGEDRLVGTGGEQCTIRFHLHPRAHASLLSSGAGVLIKLGKKELWRFHASLGEITLEESIYAGRGGLPKHSEQIVVTVPLSGNGTLVKWAFALETT
ncbi:MAG: heparinase II/III family protein [Rhodospirillaceae bacterium]|nr:heparinase II/III family protein [Rhodospirillaceae bacterium]